MYDENAPRLSRRSRHGSGKREGGFCGIVADAKYQRESLKKKKVPKKKIVGGILVEAASAAEGKGEAEEEDEEEEEEPERDNQAESADDGVEPAKKDEKGPASDAAPHAVETGVAKKRGSSDQQILFPNLKKVASGKKTPTLISLAAALSSAASGDADSDPAAAAAAAAKKAKQALSSSSSAAPTPPPTPQSEDEGLVKRQQRIRQQRAKLRQLLLDDVTNVIRVGVSASSSALSFPEVRSTSHHRRKARLRAPRRASTPSVGFSSVASSPAAASSPAFDNVNMMSQGETRIMASAMLPQRDTETLTEAIVGLKSSVR